MTTQPDWLDSLDAIQDTFGDCGTLRVLTLRKTQVRRCVGSPWDYMAQDWRRLDAQISGAYVPATGQYS